MYEYAFRVQNNLEQSAVHSGAINGAASGSLLQFNLQLTQDQFQAFRAAAQRFAPADKEVTSRIRALAAADRANHPNTRRLSEETQFQIDSLLSEKLAVATDREAALHRSLNATDAAHLDEKIVILYSEQLKKLSLASALTGGVASSAGEPSDIRAAIQSVAGVPQPLSIESGTNDCIELPDGVEEGDMEACDDGGGDYDLDTCECDPGGGGGGAGAPASPSVSFSVLTSVAQGGTATVAITVSESTLTQITLTLTTLSGTGAAQFASGGSTMTITRSTSVVLSGITASSVANNIQLDATLSTGDGSGTFSVATPGPLMFSVTPPPPSITSISPSEIAVGANDVKVTISGSGFGTSPTVNLPSGVTLSSQSVSESSIALTVSVGYVTPSNSAQITVQSASGTSKPSNITLNGPAWASVLSDVTGQNLEGTILRLVTYQVYNVDGTTVASIPIAEAFTASGWNCTNAPQPVTETNVCNGQDQTESNGQFQDTWSNYSTYYTPANCGVNVTDHWQWCSPSGPSSGITFMTLSGFIHTVSSEINGYTNPPNEIPAGTIFKP